ncbi:MAG: hypothetical protein IPJ06_12080 [Saprospiraceae bacterium]|nr:hypothetical protein [Saprospiraceae bacterium]
MAYIKILIVFCLTGWLVPISAQQNAKTPAEIATLIQTCKKEPRGPFKDIRWFCPDGSTRAARDPCPEKNGVQHARYRDEIVRLGKSNAIYLVQVLAGSDLATFWDASRGHSRIKQYQLTRFLHGVDNGWILRRARYYRGAIQEEDESAWGITFYNWLLRDEQAIKNRFFLLRQSARDVPHAADDNVAQRIRAASRYIADTFPSFMDLRVKIHGQPDVSDLEKPGRSI